MGERRMKRKRLKKYYPHLVAESPEKVVVFKEQAPSNIAYAISKVCFKSALSMQAAFSDELLKKLFQYSDTNELIVKDIDCIDIERELKKCKFLLDEILPVESSKEISDEALKAVLIEMAKSAKSRSLLRFGILLKASFDNMQEVSTMEAKAMAEKILTTADDFAEWKTEMN